MPDLGMRLGNDMIIVEGAMGTMLLEEGADLSTGVELLNLIEPETVANVHRLYRLAGADCAISNTFGGTRARLATHDLQDQAEEINRLGVEIARSQNPEHVLADIGPCGLGVGIVGSASFDELIAQYAEQARALASAGPDAFLIETMTDINDARAALFGARSVSDLPIIVTCSFGQNGRMMTSGTTPAAAAVALTAAGADVVGMNCGMDSEHLFSLMQEMASATDLPLMVQPNAGLPAGGITGRSSYAQTAEDAAAWAVKFREIGVQMVGSCCGSTPAFTAAINGRLEHLPVVERGADEGVYVASLTDRFKIEDEADLSGFTRLDLSEYDEGDKQELEDDVLRLPMRSPLVIYPHGSELLEKALEVYSGRVAVAFDDDLDEQDGQKFAKVARRYGAVALVKDVDCAVYEALVCEGFAPGVDMAKAKA